MVEKLTRNIGWKITSLILAFLLWFVVVKFEDPVIDKKFEDIPVMTINENEITSKQMAIEYKEGLYVDVELRGKRSVLEKVKETNIQAVADMKYISLTGAVPINILTDESIVVINKKPTNMLVELEDIITVQREIQSLLEGKPKDSYVATTVSIEPNTIQITGPESKVGLISSVVVPININGASRDITLPGSIKVLDDNNNEITNLNKSINDVNVQITIQKIKTVPISFKQVDSLREGYELNRVSIIPDKITLIGSEDKLDRIDKIEIDNILLNNLVTSSTEYIDVSNKIPNDVSLYNSSSEVIIKLDIERLSQKGITIHTDDISVKLPNDLQLAFLEQQDITLMFKGKESDLEKISVETLNPNINVTNLEEGIHELDIRFTVPTGVAVVDDIPKVKIELKK